MTKNNYEKYLSLKSAAQLYGYTRDHLGLMIRRGKLRGLKLGNYYVTTADWMIEYVKKYVDPNHPIHKNKLSNKFLAEALLNEGEEVILKNKIKSAGAKNLAAKSKIQPQNTGFAVSKSTDEPPKVDLQAEILKELSRFRTGLSEKNADANLKPQDNPLLERGNLPYIILPVRKMESFERNEILRRIKPENDGNNFSESV